MLRINLKKVAFWKGSVISLLFLCAYKKNLQETLKIVVDFWTSNILNLELNFSKKDLSQEHLTCTRPYGSLPEFQCDGNFDNLYVNQPTNHKTKQTWNFYW